jgi:hypothetical protein
MGRTFLVAGVCACFALCCFSAEEIDWLIVPGKRVGPITAATTRADLKRMFGAKNVEESGIQASDLLNEIGTKINWHQADSSLAILWISEAADSRIRRVLFCPNLVQAAKCRWHTAEGLSLGMPLKDLERVNGREFALTGFDWGFGGLITSWNGGRLDKLSASCGGMTIRLDPPPGPASQERAQWIDAVEENEEFSSSHAAMQALNPVVDFLSLSFQNCR